MADAAEQQQQQQQEPAASRDALIFPEALAAPLSPYMPPPSPPPPSSSLSSSNHTNKPFTTLTFATSLDSSLSLAPGTRTALSGPLSKAMTHHLRASHDAILVGAGTALADDPGLNCRIRGVGGYGDGREAPLHRQPRPVVVDARGRWEWCAEDGGDVAKVLQLARQARGRAPWVLVGEGVAARLSAARRRVLEDAGGRVLEVGVGADGFMAWGDVLAVLGREGVGSVMIEGGAGVINALLEPRNMALVDSVIVTIAPTWLGRGGVVVSPPPRMDGEGGGGGGGAVPAARLRDVRWCPMGEDVVLCGRLGA
ncbi:dihydrofolate reductase-like domain-containing protein [Phyllosticta citrichinensis]|uniref:2,5-diamino-6-ribosylamino-4(3H)-pyrimidinone 5'-phosphate reductase n=1 Tax=Phyllosticta citrichinensis TaxID=1130410 RepID=A0ABR1Y4F0_9PEZI